MPCVVEIRGGWEAFVRLAFSSDDRSSADDGEQTDEDVTEISAEINRMLAIIDRRPVASDDGKVASNAGGDWAECLSLAEQLGRAARDSTGRARNIELRMQSLAKRASEEITASRHRIETLETQLQEAEQREQHLTVRLHDAEQWLHRIQKTLRDEVGSQSAANVPPSNVLI